MICIPIIAKNTDAALEKIIRANTLADMLEIRLDLMDTFDLTRILQTADKPVLVTYRSKNEGGKGSADPDTYTQYALAALRLGADLVDVELWLPVKWRERIFNARGQSGIVISSHIQYRHFLSYSGVYSRTGKIGKDSRGFHRYRCGCCQDRNPG
jgi:3-dehydroquinate dehydratase type I